MPKLLLLAVFPALLGAAQAAASAGDVETVRSFRTSHEKQILSEFSALLELPNVATSVPDIERNAAFIRRALEKRGFITDLMRGKPGTPPAVYGELLVPGATRTLVFYAHYDGQPVAQDGWRSDPFRPLVRAGHLAATSREVDWRAAGKIDPDWRIYARSASDDKAPIQAMLSALDGLQAAGRTPRVNIKVFYEGEEEQGSPNLEALLAIHAQRLAGDLFVLSDGPVHQTGRRQLFFGARGTAAVEVTVYGPSRPLHSGHYGNWAPNPAVSLVHLLASLRAEDGRILIPGFQDDVRPVTSAERAAITALPNVEALLKDELSIGRTEGEQSLGLSIMRPALNLRGIRVGAVGKDASNTIATEAKASIDFRLVPDQTPAGIRNRFEQFLKKKGWYVIHRDAAPAERRSHARVVRLDWTLSYAAYRTNVESTDARRLSDAIREATGEVPLRLPMLGGSVPMKVFGDALKMPVIGLPIANYDNNQHGANENLRIGNLWDAIDIYAALLTQAD